MLTSRQHRKRKHFFIKIIDFHIHRWLTSPNKSTVYRSQPYVDLVHHELMLIWVIFTERYRYKARILNYQSCIIVMADNCNAMIEINCTVLWLMTSFLNVDVQVSTRIEQKISIFLYNISLLFFLLTRVKWCKYKLVLLKYFTHFTWYSKIYLRIKRQVCSSLSHLLNSRTQFSSL